MPDKAASTANENATNAVPKSRKTYEEIACNILKIYKEDSARAKLIAAKMNIENIQKAMSRFIPSSLGEDICLSLNFAVQAVLHDQIDEKAPSLIKLQWENIELNRKIDTLAQQMLRSI